MYFGIAIATRRAIYTNYNTYVSVSDVVEKICVHVYFGIGMKRFGA